MGRVAKKTPEAAKTVEESPSTVTLTRAKRTPKPNPKYANDSIIATPKAILESSESNGSSDIEDKLPETKIVKSTKKVIGKNEESAVKGKSVTKAKSLTVIKKQKIEFDDDEKTKDADEIPPLDRQSPQPAPRSTRSGKTSGEIKEEKSEIKVGEESVAIVDVSSIISKNTAAKVQNQDSSKVVRTIGGRKRPAEAAESAKEDSPKKKKEDERPSNITARKSYIQLPTVAIKKSESATDTKGEDVKDELTVEEEIKKEESKTPISTMKTRRNAGTPQSAQSAEPEDKKPKLEPVLKAEPTVKNTTLEPKKLPMIRKEQITKVSPVTTPPVANVLPTKVNNNATPVSVNSTAKPVTRILNSMVTPKGVKGTPNVKLAGDGTDKKVFSIEMSDGSIVEKKAEVISPVKPSPAIKENVAINKPQPSVLLKNKLESELNRMKASASMMRRQVITSAVPAVRHSTGSVPAPVTQVQNITPTGARRVTKFESWYVINVKNEDPAPLKHTHTYSLTRLGNRIKDIQLPSSDWDYKVTLQRKQKKENNNEDDEVYTGNVMDHSIAPSEKQNFEPSSILFKRSNRDNNKVMIDRSLMLKGNMYAITMNGKQCHLVGAPSDILSIEDLEILLKIIDTCNPNHSCVETG